MAKPRGSSEATIKKYLDALSELQILLSYSDKIGVNEFFEKKQIGSVARHEIMRAGLIKNTGTRRKSRFVWDTKDPDRQMVLAILRKVSVNARKSRIRGLEKKARLEEDKRLAKISALYVDTVETVGSEKPKPISELEKSLDKIKDIEPRAVVERGVPRAERRIETMRERTVNYPPQYFIESSVTSYLLGLFKVKRKYKFKKYE